MTAIMKALTFFYLSSCPYCRQADLMIAKFKSSAPEYAEVPIEKIEERQHPEVAEQYDYYYVPCFFLGKEKLFEGVPSEEEIKKVLDTAVRS